MRKISFGTTLTTSSWVVGLKALSQALKLLIFTLYGDHLNPIFNLFNLFWHHFQGRFRLQSTTHSSYKEVRCSKLVDQTSEQNTGINLHHLLFIIRTRLTPQLGGPCFQSSHSHESATHVHIRTNNIQRITHRQLITHYNN